MDAKQLDLSARVVKRLQEAEGGPIVHSLAPAAHLAAQLCEELLKGGSTKGSAPSRDALWTRAVIHTAECALRKGIDQPHLALAGALTLFNFERHTPKTAPSPKQVAEAAGLAEDALMEAYLDLLPHMEERLDASQKAILEPALGAAAS